MGTIPSATRWVPAAVFVVALALSLGLHARILNDDLYDELILVEQAAPTALAKHPLAEPTVWLMRRATFGTVRARPIARVFVALSFAAFMSGLVVLAEALAGHAPRDRARGWPLALWLLSTSALLHLAIDPYLFYLLPGLALAAWAFVFAARGAKRAGLAAAVLLALALLFAPPLAAACALAAAWRLRRRDRRGALLALVLPAAALAIAWLVAAPPTGGILYGRWLPGQAAAAFTVLLSAIAFHPAEAMVHGYDLRWLAPLAGIVAAGLAIFAVLARALDASPARRLDAAAAFVAAALMLGFVAWWDPLQGLFHVIPIFFFTIGGLALPPSPPGRRRIVPVASFVPAGLLFAWNITTYLVPVHRGPDPREDAATALAAHFAPHDVVVFEDFAELAFEYHTGIASRGFVSLMADSPDVPLPALLDRLLAEAEGRGGTVWIEVGPDGVPHLSPWATARLPHRLEPELLRARLGEPLRAGGSAFRPLLAR